jgi:hypothetical protein
MKNKRVFGWVIFIAILVAWNVAYKQGLVPFFVF